ANREIDINSLKEHLSAYLTAYMVPQAFMQLDEMPLTANGKIDKKVLPVIEIAEEEIVPAENEMQEQIISIVAGVIGSDRIGITTDLFAAGLSSIGCIKLCSLLSNQFGKNIKVADIYENKTVRAIEKLINEKADEEKHEVRSEYPLSMTQMGIFVDSIRYQGSTVYNIPFLYRLDDTVEMERLRAAAEKVIAAHPYLSMTIKRDENGDVWAVRNPDPDIEISVFDSMPEKQELVRPFDLLSSEKLYRIELFNTADGKYLFIDTHHIISDGESLTIFFEDLNKAYNGGEIETEKYTGFEFALDEQTARNTDRLEKAKAWHDSIFRGCEPCTAPVKDGKPSDVHIANTECVGAEIADKVRGFCREHRVTPNAFFTAVFGLALKAYTNSEDAVFTSIYNGRSDARTQNSIAMFVKTLPVMFRTGKDRSIVSMIEECQSYLLSAMAHDIFSFAEISNAYGIHPDVMFEFQDDDEVRTSADVLNMEEIDLELSQAKSSLSANISLSGGKITYEFEYDPAEYSEYTIKGLIHLIDTIACEMLTKENAGDISLTTDRDREDILKLHDSDFAVRERPAYRLLQDSAEKYPDRNAVIAVDRTLTYRELNEEANALGHLLRDNGAQPETIVAVMAERDSYAYIMRQGALKSGGAFLPIDPEYPEERIRYILENSNSKLLVTTASVIEKRKDLLDALSNEGVTVVNAQEAVSNGDKNNLNIDVPYEALAYVIYTSGSTGKPKGVMLTNKNLVNFVNANEKNHEILGYTERGHVSLAIAALTFDVSVFEELVPFANGMTVVFATNDQIMDAIQLRDLIVENKVEVMTCTPSYLLNMIEIDAFAPAVKQLNTVDVGAEAFPPALFTKLREVHPDLYIMN
ncbi:MAG: AMP-binding protein, partial [Clostridia bacterium]|nr:AMP-binding protein [Clostridia bacterium]